MVRNSFLYHNPIHTHTHTHVCMYLRVYVKLKQFLSLVYMTHTDSFILLFVFI